MGSTPEDPTNHDGTGVRQRRPYAFAVSLAVRGHLIYPLSSPSAFLLKRLSYRYK